MPYGPDNPHPLSRLTTELVWEGKYDEYGNRRPIHLPTTPLPLQRIETTDEPRDREKARQLSLFDEIGFNKQAHRDDFRNMLIWGDNKLAMAALMDQFRGKIDLIYIDPPFDVGADFSIQVQLGGEDEAVQKEQSILEAVAYRDTWGKGTNSYLHMLYERLILMRELLNNEGSIYVHVGPNISHAVKMVLDEVFGISEYQNDIIWKRTGAHNDARRFGIIHDNIFFYTKGQAWQFTQVFTEYTEDYIAERFRSVEPDTGRRYWLNTMTAAGQGPPRLFNDVLRDPPQGTHWRYSQVKIDEFIRVGKIVFTDSGMPYVKQYLDESRGRPPQSIWEDLVPSKSGAERVGYDTQKPEALIERIIRASSKKGDLIADLFCGSGTTLAVSEKLGRRWIGVDLGRFAIHTTRKRLIQIQHELHDAGEPYRSFDVYNLGRYERQWWQLDRLKGADAEHRKIVLKFYKAVTLDNPTSTLLHGKKSGAYIHIAQIDSIFNFPELHEVALAAQSSGGRELHCLAWEFEMELALKKPAVEAETGLTIRLKYIPREIMEPNRSECQFFEAGFLEARAIQTEKKVDVELVRFIPALAEAPENEIAALRDRAVRSPFDFIDFWAVDFDYQEGQPFEHHWQDFRTRKDRGLKTKSDLGWEYPEKGKHHICVKVIDVFGVDTTTVIDLEV